MIWTFRVELRDFIARARNICSDIQEEAFRGQGSQEFEFGFSFGRVIIWQVYLPRRAESNGVLVQAMRANYDGSAVHGAPSVLWSGMRVRFNGRGSPERVHGRFDGTHRRPAESPEFLDLNEGHDLSGEFEDAHDGGWGDDYKCDSQEGGAERPPEARTVVRGVESVSPTQVVHGIPVVRAVPVTSASTPFGSISPTQVASGTPVTRTVPAATDDTTGRETPELSTVPHAVSMDQTTPLALADQPAAAIAVLEARRLADEAKADAAFLRERVATMQMGSDFATVLKSMTEVQARTEQRRVASEFKSRITDTTSVEEAANTLYEIAQLPLDARAATVRKAVTASTLDGAMRHVRTHEFKFDGEAAWVSFCAGLMGEIETDCISKISARLLGGYPWPTGDGDGASKYRTAKSAAVKLAAAYSWLGKVVFAGNVSAALSFDATAATEARCLLSSLPAEVRDRVESKLNGDTTVMSRISGFEQAALFELGRGPKRQPARDPTGDVSDVQGTKRQQLRSPRREDRQQSRRDGRQSPRQEDRRPDPRREDRRTDRDSGRGHMGREPHRGVLGRWDGGGRGYGNTGTPPGQRQPPQQPPAWQMQQQPPFFAAAAHAAYVSPQQAYAPPQQAYSSPGQQQVFTPPQGLVLPAAQQPPQIFPHPVAALTHQPQPVAALAHQPQPPSYPPPGTTGVREARSCFHCGDTTHFAASCPRGPQCYNCREYGHMSKECRQPRTTGHLNRRR